MSVTPDADLDLQPPGGDQVPVPSGDVGLGSRPAPKHQALRHYPLHAPAGGHGHHQQPVREWEDPGGCGEEKGRRGRAQMGRKAPEYLTPGDGSLLAPWLSLLDPLFGDPLRLEWGATYGAVGLGDPPPWAG